MAAETETNRSEGRDDENRTCRIGAAFDGVSLLPGDLRGPEGGRIFLFVLLDVVEDNLPAIRLYERLGFAPTGRRQEFQDFCGHVALREYALAL